MGYRRPDASTTGSSRIARIRRVLWVVLVLNLAVALAKLGWGLLTNSTAMQADGFHSLFDGASNVVGLVGISIASRPADRTHPYGHSKYETYASAAIAGMLVFAPAWIPPDAFPLGYDDIQELATAASCAVAVAQERAPEFGGDPTWTAVHGFSAGAGPAHSAVCGARSGGGSLLNLSSPFGSVKRMANAQQPCQLQFFTSIVFQPCLSGQAAMNWSPR